MATTVFVSIGALGHAFSCAVLAREWQRRGHAGLLLLPQTLAHFGKVCECNYRLYSSATQASAGAPRHFDGFAMSHIPAGVAREIAVALPVIREILREVQADCVVHDYFTFAAKLAAESLGIPAVSLNPTYAFTEPFNFVRDTMEGKIKGEVSSARTLEEFDGITSELWQRFQLAPRTFCQLISAPDELQIVGMPRELHPCFEQLPASTRFVGPLFDNRLEADFFGPACAISPRQRPAVLVSFGTVFHVQFDFYRSLLASVADLDADVWLLTGDCELLGATVPENVQVIRSASLIGTLAHVDLLITHGGMGSVLRSLWWGRPMLVVPQFPEQWYTARRLQEFGVARNLPVEVSSPEQLRVEIEYLLATPSFARHAQDWQSILKRTSGASLAVDLLELR